MFCHATGTYFARRRAACDDPSPRARATPGDNGHARSRAGAARDERAYAEAQRRADLKIGFLRQLTRYAATVFVLVVVTGPVVASIVAFWWGLGLLKHYLSVFVFPPLRERWVEREVRQRGGTEERPVATDARARALEELSAQVAHDLRNPITPAKSLVQQMGEDPASPENVEYARVALDELARVERSISHLLRYARDVEPHPAAMRMADVLDAALAAARDRTARLRVRVERQFDGDGAMTGDPEQLRRVAGNLIGNALDVLEAARTPAPTLTVATGGNLAGTEVWVRVRDNGPGMPSAAVEKIFEPFYTSKPDGTGLGLAIAKKLVDAHGGRIEVHSAPGAGTEFVLTLPRHGTAQRVEARP